MSASASTMGLPLLRVSSWASPSARSRIAAAIRVSTRDRSRPEVVRQPDSNAFRALVTARSTSVSSASGIDPMTVLVDGSMTSINPVPCAASNLPLMNRPAPLMCRDYPTLVRAGKSTRATTVPVPASNMSDILRVVAVWEYR
jgi:hypothetical protein